MSSRVSGRKHHRRDSDDSDGSDDAEPTRRHKHKKHRHRHDRQHSRSRSPKHRVIKQENPSKDHRDGRHRDRDYDPEKRPKHENDREEDRRGKHRRSHEVMVKLESPEQSHERRTKCDRERRPERIKEERGRPIKREVSDERRRKVNDERRRNPNEGRRLELPDAPPPPAPREKPNFAVSGQLTADVNTYRGVVIKYNEPPEARKPKRKWRFYVFKGDEDLPLIHIHRQSAYLLGRERRIADLPIDHPSCSKQHAVLQYRLVAYDRPDGTTGKRVRPYIIDLESSNGTYLNNNRIDAKRYYELQEKDVVKFGYSTREYVLLHDKSKDSDVEEDVGED